MAFSFTLPELRAELRALGHDGLPDHLILSFLSQLDLPLLSPASPSVSSGYDTESSTCSNIHSLSCSYGSSKECSFSGEHTGARAVEGCEDHLCSSPHLRKTLSGGSDERRSCVKCSALPETNCASEFDDRGAVIITASRLREGFSSNGNTTSRRPSPETLFRNRRLPNSRDSAECEKSMDRANGAEIILNEKNSAKSVDFADTDLGECGHATPGHVGDANQSTVLGFCRRGCRTSGSHHGKGIANGKQGNTDSIIEHYWMSVGKEHMRAMHSKISKEKEQSKEPSVLESHGDADASNGESKPGCESSVAKVQQCVNEMRCVNLTLQAQQCKKPCFLEAAGKPRVVYKEKHDMCSESDSLFVVNPMLASDSTLVNVEGCANRSVKGQSFEVMGNNITNTLEAYDQASGIPCSSSLEHVSTCLEAEVEISTMSEELSQQMRLGTGDEGDTMEVNLATLSSVGDVEKRCQIHDSEDKVLADECLDQNNDPDHSVCSKSSSASHQHSSSSGDSKTNPSQKFSSPQFSRKRQQHKKRGGKIDRVARFAEMQQLWKKDTFLAANELGGKRKGVQSFHRLFSSLHSSSTC